MVFLKYSLGFTVLICSAFHFSSPTLFDFLKKEHYILTNGFQEKTDLEKSIAKGKEVYTDFCMQCHLDNGKGDGKNFPPLDASDWLAKKNNKSIHAVKFGQSGEIVVNGKKFNNTMPPMGLSNQEVADVMNYIRNSWSNKNTEIITAQQVEAIKK